MIRNRVQQYLNHVGYTDADLAAKKALYGIILLKFGTGSIGIWGVINIYLFSFFHEQDDSLRMSDFTLLVTIVTLPISLATIFSVQLATKVGFERLIIIAMIISPISILIGSTQEDFSMFILLNTFIPGLCFGLTVMPIISSLWTHFPEKTGSVTGIALASFGLSSFFYSILATYIVNPDNLPATISYEEGSQTYKLFEEEVTTNVPSMALWFGIIQSLFCIPGAFLISRKPQKNEQINSPIEMELLEQEKNLKTQEPKMTLIMAIKSAPFIIIYASTFFLSCFSLFVSLNLKTYGLTKINDDHFITIIMTVCTLISSISNLLWGFLVDSYKFRTVYLNLIIIIIISGFLFPYLASTKLGFFLTFQVLGASERGLYTIIGPGLVKIFGVKLGSELFPIKGTSFFFALITMPLIQLILVSEFNYDEVIHILLLGNVAAYFISRKLQTQYSFNI